MCRLIPCMCAFLLVAPALAAPPRVVSASPENGASDVDPATRQIRIVFDQPMSRDGFSIVGGGPKFPRLVGQPRWADERTLLVECRLEGDHDYWLSINSDRFTNFRNRAGEAAIPYPIAFRTRPGKAAEKLTPEVNRAAIAQLRQAIDRQYSYRDLHRVDWDKAFADAEAKLLAAQSPADFARAAGAMLAATQDMHIWLQAGDQTFPSFQRSVRPNVNPAILPRLVPKLARQGRNILTGEFDDGIRYLMIGSFSGDPAEFKAACEWIGASAKAPALVIDVRPNAGGSESLAGQIAGCFVEKPTLYARHILIEDGKLSEPHDRVLQPNAAVQRFPGRVAVLMGRANMSSCEAFLLMMKQAPRATLVGETSYGASGNPQPHPLENGVTVYLPVWKALRPDGTCFETEGIAPNLKVAAPAAAFETSDPVLAAALDMLRKAK